MYLCRCVVYLFIYFPLYSCSHYDSFFSHFIFFLLRSLGIHPLLLQRINLLTRCKIHSVGPSACLQTPGRIAIILLWHHTGLVSSHVAHCPLKLDILFNLQGHFRTLMIYHLNKMQIHQWFIISLKCADVCHRPLLLDADVWSWEGNKSEVNGPQALNNDA